MFRSLRIISICLVSFFLFNNQVYADKFPEGYPECWKDAKNAVDTNYAAMDSSKKNLGQHSNLFCPINPKVGHKFFLVDFTSPLKRLKLPGYQKEFLRKLYLKILLLIIKYLIW